MPRTSWAGDGKSRQHSFAQHPPPGLQPLVQLTEGGPIGPVQPQSPANEVPASTTAVATANNACNFMLLPPENSIPIAEPGQIAPAEYPSEPVRLERLIEPASAELPVLSSQEEESTQIARIAIS
jgi:hypothetical protein